MKKLLLLPLLLMWAGGAQAQTYEKLPPKYYGTTLKTVTAYRSMTDTVKWAVHIPQADQVQVIGRIVPDWAVVNRGGFTYYMPSRYLAGFSADPQAVAAEPVQKIPRTEEYCLVLATQKFLSTKVVIAVDFGQARSYFQDNRAKDAYGNVQNFNSVIDALNYMNSLGWEFVNAYSVTMSSSNVYHYLMRRRIKP